MAMHLPCSAVSSMVVAMVLRCNYELELEQQEHRMHQVVVAEFWKELGWAARVVINLFLSDFEWFIAILVTIFGYLDNLNLP